MTLVTFLSLMLLVACGGPVPVQCDQSFECDLSSGGICRTAPSGNRWCSYPDSSCASGYRYSDFQTGDGISGVCVPIENIDAGIDAMQISPEMVLVPSVPSGLFMMGCNASVEGATVCNDPAQSDELPDHAVMVDSFLIDKLEVSRAKYKDCVDAHVCVATGGDDTSELPVAVTWAQAATYCSWATKRLPTEAEWEKAARGTDGRTYPWGSTPPNCILVDFVDCGGGYVTVDSLPAGASPYGALNMAGNISEWVRDFYQPDYYVASPSSNPPGPSTGTSNVLRGGNGISPASELRVSSRASKAIGLGGYGFRCARNY